MAILERIPDLSVTANSSLRVQGDLSALLGTLNGLQPGVPSSPLAALFGAFGELRTRLDIDPQAVTGGLSTALVSIQNALPANALAYAESLGSAYQDVAALLSDSDIARQVGEGQTLNAVAQAVINEALQLFETHINDLAGNLVDAERLQQVRAALNLIQNLEQDYAAHEAELLPLLANHLLGVAPDLLDAPLAHVQSVLDLLKPLAAPDLLESLGPARRAIMGAYAALLETIDTFNPADAAGYTQITLHLGQLEAANNLLFTALNTLYTQLDAAIAAGAWDTVFATYIDLLNAVDLGTVPTIDDVTMQLETVISELLTGMLDLFDADDLRSRIDVLSQSLRDAVLGSPVGQVKQTIEGFLVRIRAAVESVPTEDVQRVVNEMLAKVQSAVQALDLVQVQQQIEQVFAGVDEFVNTHLNVNVRQNLQIAIEGLSAQLNSLRLSNLLDDLNSALGQLQNLISELASALQGEIQSLEEFLSQAETLSFKPVSDAVVAEIDELKTRLAAINPDALSDAEKLALTGALAFLEAIDLQAQVIDGLKGGYHSAENEIRVLFNQVVAALNQLRDKVFVFNPETILQPINAVLEGANTLLDQLNARTLLAPLYTEIASLQGLLGDLAPGRLLAPLQAVFDQSLGLLNRLDPAQWVAPLDALYAQIDRLISLVDITPVMDELDRKQRQLMGRARTAILAGFDSLDLPEPLNGFFAEMRPVIELVTEAVFGDPDVQIKQISIAIRQQVRLGTLFAPLDAAFLRLVTMIEKVPPAELTAAMNIIRQSIGVGLDVLNPQTLLAQLRAGYGRLQEIAPASLLGQTVNLPSLKAYFALKVEAAPPGRSGDISTVMVRFEAVTSVTMPGASGSQYAQLVTRHAEMLHSLRRRINTLDHSEASSLYANLHQNLDRVLPDFLRQTTPLAHADILAGLQRMRPSNRVAAIEDLFTRFLQRLEPYESAIEPAVNGFFGTLREIMLLLNPLSLRDSVASIFAAVRQKSQILDPAQLTVALNAILDPLQDAVQTLSPAALAARIDESFNNTVRTVGETLKALLDDLVALIDGQLRTLRAGLRLVLDQLKAAMAAALSTVQDLVQQIEDLVFVEIIERLGRVIDNLGVSFDQELDRVANAFDEMLQAVPLGGGSAGGGISL